MALPASVDLPTYPWPLDARQYDAEFLRMAMQAHVLNAEGIAPTSSLTGTSMPGDLKPVTGGSALTVSVPAGRAFVQGDGRTTQGSYFCFVDVAKTVTMSAANGALPRVDALLLRVEDSDISGANNQWSVTKQDGTATAGATLVNLTGAPGQGGGPALQATAMVIGYVLTPAAFAGPYVTVTHILDARALAFAAQSATMTLSANQGGVVTGTQTQVNVNTILFDNARMADTANNQIIVRASGTYSLNGCVEFAAAVAGTRVISDLHINGSQYLVNRIAVHGDAGTAKTAFISCTRPLSAGDTVNLQGNHNSGVNSSFLASNTYLSVSRIG